MDDKNHSTDTPYILYVDDDPSNRSVFEITFREEFAVKTAESGAAALEILKSANIGVVVTDQRMPGMTGHQLLQHVRAQHPRVLRIAVTAFGELDDILKAVNQGLVARYVTKPWDLHEFEALLRWALEAYILGGQDSALQERLLQTERLVTLGGIAASTLHDLNQPLAYFKNNSTRLTQLARATSLIHKLVHKNTTHLSAHEHEQIQDLLDELPDIADDLVTGCDIMLDLTRNMNQIIRKQNNDNVNETSQPMVCLKYAMSLCETAVRRVGGQLHYDGPDVLPDVNISQTEFIQILFNLINNAAGALQDSTSNVKKVTIQAHAQTGHVLFVVRDTGIGIPEALVKHVGQAFFSTKNQGTGLGVAQCRRLVGKSGGTFELSSTQGKGTQVSFTIPCLPAS